MPFDLYFACFYVYACIRVIYKGHHKADWALSTFTNSTWSETELERIFLSPYFVIDI